MNCLRQLLVGSMLSLGLLTHLFTATVFTRMLLAVWVRYRRPTELVI